MKRQAAQPNTTPAVAHGANRANMPANNVTGQHTTVKAKTGSGQHNSQFARPKATPGSAKSGKQNMPAKNVGTKTPNLGTTHHPVGQVPAYLKRSK